MLKAQISTRINILKFESDRIATSKATLEELKRHLLHSMTIPIPEEISDLYDLILDPRKVVGCDFSQRWEEDWTSRWYQGYFVSCSTTERGLLDFEVTYGDDPTVSYLSPEQILVDIIRGDFELY